MTSGDIGVVIMATVNGLGFNVPSGSSVMTVAAPGTIASCGSELLLGPATFSPDGSTVYYVTQGNGLDYQSGGYWVTKFVVNTPDGRQFTTPPGQFYVFAQ